MQVGDRAGLTTRFANALATAFLMCQPIGTWSARVTYAYETLIRSAEPTIAVPNALFDAADRLHSRGVAVLPVA